jgi:hypothetical protein
MAMIDGGSEGFVIKSCKQGIAVFSEDALHVIAYVVRLVGGIDLGCGAELGIGAGLGYVYSCMGSLNRSASVRSWRGRYGNASSKCWMLSEL